MWNQLLRGTVAQLRTAHNNIVRLFLHHNPQISVIITVNIIVVSVLFLRFSVYICTSK